MTSIDVGIPCYNYGRYLREAVTSVLSQDVPNLRLLIVDNASTDDSPEIARQIAAEDSRVTLHLNEHNRGYVDSVNRVFDWASSDYLVLFDADDVMTPGALALGSAFLDEHPDVSFLYGVEGRMTDGLVDPGRRDPNTTRWNVTSGEGFIRRTCRDSVCDIGYTAVMRRTSAQKKAGHFRPGMLTSDFEMYLRLAMVGDVANTNRVLGIRRMHAEQLSGAHIKDRVADFVDHEAAFGSFFANEGSVLGDAAELREQARRKMGDYAYWYAVSQRLRGRSAAEALHFAAERRTVPGWAPPLGYLFKKRWLRNVWRVGRRMTHNPTAIESVLPSPGYARLAS